MAIPAEATAVNLVTYPVTLYALTGEYDDPETFDTVYVKTDGTGWDERRTNTGAPRCAINGPQIRVPALAEYAGQRATVYLEVTLASGYSRDGNIRIWADGAQVSEIDGRVVPGLNVKEFTVPSAIVDPETLELRLNIVSTGDDTGLKAARVAPGPDDGLGVIYGGDEHGTQWSGDPWTSASYIPLEDPDPEDPDPEDPDPEDPDPEDPDPEDPDPEDPDPEDPDPEDPDPEDPDPEDPGLAARVLAYADMKPTERRLALAQSHVEVVTAYVYGYTRGHGFTDSGRPSKQLESVIISATARLTVNPRQMTYYTTGDYSERPAVLAGWTLLERAVLNNYRRTWA